MSEELSSPCSEATAHEALASCCHAAFEALPEVATGVFVDRLKAAFGQKLIAALVKELKAGLTDPAAILAALAAVGVVVPAWLVPLIPTICALLSGLLNQLPATT